MEIFELAEELGKALKADARLVALDAAKTAYEENNQLHKYMIEYEVQQKALQGEAAKGDAHDLNLMEIIQKRIDELYALISEHPAFQELNRAQAEVNALMNRVNQTIMKEITGEEPDAGCTHDCSTCGGCH